LNVARVVVLLLLLASGAGAGPAQERAKGDWRALLDAVDTPENERLNAALELVATDLPFLRERLAEPAIEPVVRAILRALEIRAATAPNVTAAVPELFALAASAEPPELRGAAEATLAELYRAAPGAVLPLVFTTLHEGQPQEVEAAVRALGRFRDLAAAEPLVEVLRAVNGTSRLARVIADALEQIVPVPLGPDPDAWSALLASYAGLGRDRILEDLLAKERAANREALAAKHDEIIRLTMALHGDDPEALVRDLEHELPEIRRYAAEALIRRPSDWDTTAARELLLDQLEAGGGPADVRAAFLDLLFAIETGAGHEAAADPRRDAVVAACLRSGVPEVVVAAAAAARRVPSEAVGLALLDTLREVDVRPLTPEARTALVNASGELGLSGAKDMLISILYRDESVDARVAAASNLGKLGAAEARDDLARALREDADWRVRRRAAVSLHAVAGAGALEALVKALDDEKPEVRSEVAQVLGTFADERAAAALLKRLRVEAAVRADVVRALGETRAQSALPDLCAEAIGSAPPSASAGAGDVALRSEARDALRKVAGSDPALWREIIADTREKDAVLEAWAYGSLAAVLAEKENEAAAIIDARLGQARALARAEQWDSVVTVTAQVLGAALAPPPDPQRASLLHLRAVALERLGRDDEAVQTYEALVESDRLAPAEHGSSVMALARLVLAAGDAARAEKLLARLLESSPTGPVGAADAPAVPEVVVQLAAAERRNGGSTRAIARLRELLERDGLDPGLARRARVELLEALLAAATVDEARVVLAEIDAMQPMAAGTLDPGLETRIEAARVRLHEAAAPGESPSGESGESGAFGGAGSR
jgi:HEAT repeat protein